MGNRHSNPYPNFVDESKMLVCGIYTYGGLKRKGAYQGGRRPVKAVTAHGMIELRVECDIDRGNVGVAYGGMHQREKKSGATYDVVQAYGERKRRRPDIFDLFFVGRCG
jgi:hypothetical protein